MPKFLGENYLEQQIYSYNRDLAIENIKLNHCNDIVIDKGVFNPNINIEDIYDYADNYIKTINSIGTLKYGRRVFRFYYPNCGLVATNEVANGFCAVTSLSDKNIIAIFMNYSFFKYASMSSNFIGPPNKDNALPIVKSKLPFPAVFSSFISSKLWIPPA